MVDSKRRANPTWHSRTPGFTAVVSSKVLAHPRSLAVIERFEQSEQAGESLPSELGTQLVLDLSSCRSQYVEIVDTPGGEDHRLFPLAGRRVGDRDVATIAKVLDDLAGALASDAELASDGRDRRSGQTRTQPEHPPIGKSSLAEPRVGHGGVESKLIAQPGTTERWSEA